MAKKGIVCIWKRGLVNEIIKRYSNQLLGSIREHDSLGLVDSVGCKQFSFPRVQLSIFSARVEEHGVCFQFDILYFSRMTKDLDNYMSESPFMHVVVLSHNTSNKVVVNLELQTGYGPLRPETIYSL